MSAPPLAERLMAGETRALARAIRMVEDRDPGIADLLRQVRERAGLARVVGVTGPPGSGQRTLCDQAIERGRAGGHLVGVIAVDPSSPFTGGAILGDRVRMVRHTLDPGVFIRSMAARGHLGGLAAAAREAIRLVDASGRDRCLLETVGGGASELRRGLPACWRQSGLGSRSSRSWRPPTPRSWSRPHPRAMPSRSSKPGSSRS